jgi:hypothetical protein
MIVDHHYPGTVEAATRASSDPAPGTPPTSRVRRGLARAVALTCAAAALTPAVATAAPPETGSCPIGTRAVGGVAGTGCTTSPRDGSDGVAALAVILTGAGAFAIVRDVRAQAGRRRRRLSAETALSEPS